jgi:hypothetical protein
LWALRHLTKYAGSSGRGMRLKHLRLDPTTQKCHKCIAPERD